jgi:hypothetical protein
MRQIALICGILLVLLVGTTGCLYIFDVLSFESARSGILKFGSAIILLSVCAAIITLMMGGRKDA